MEREIFRNILLEQKTVTLRYAIKGFKGRMNLAKNCNSLTQSEVNELIRELYKIASCIDDVIFEHYEFKFTDEEHTLEMYDCLEELKELQDTAMRLDFELRVIGENLTSGLKS